MYRECSEKHRESHRATRGAGNVIHARTPRPGQQRRSIRCSLKVGVKEKVQLEECIKKEKLKFQEIRGNPEYDDGIREGDG